MNISSPPSTQSDQTIPPQTTDGWGIAVTALFLGIIFLCVLVGPTLGWLVWEAAGISGLQIENWIIPMITGIEGGLLWLLFFLFGGFWSRSKRYRAVFQTWALAAFFTLLMIPLRVIIPINTANAANWGAFWQIIGVFLFIAVLFGVSRYAKRSWTWRVKANRWPAFLIMPLLLMPFFVTGSLGSPLDFVIQLLAGLSFGLALGRLIGQFLLPTLYETTTGDPWDFFLGSVTIFGALLLMAPAYGLFGQSALLLMILPAATLLLMGSMRWGQATQPSNWLTLSWVAGLLTAGLLILTDADELNLYLAIEPGEIFLRHLQAGLISIGIALFFGILALFFPHRLNRMTDPVGSSIASGLWLIAILAFALAGNPGFYGDRLFVVMNKQADVSAAEQIEDLDERRTFVYQALVAQAETSQSSILKTLDRFNIDHQSYYLVNAIEVKGGPFIRLWLNSRPEVDRIIDSFDARPLPFASPTAEGLLSSPEGAQTPWNLEIIAADRVWSELEVKGAGVVVGNSDSGVQVDHPEFADSYRGRNGNHNFNWFDPWSGSPAPVDFNGHGTHTLGTVLGNIVGVAPDAEWIACANLQRPLGNPGTYIACLEFMLAPFPPTGNPQKDGRPELAADVLNNSWACPPIEGCDPFVLQPAVDALRVAGIFVVASAGNDGEGGCSTINSPIAIYDSVFSVGASTRSEDLATFSSRGPVTVDGSGRSKPDIVAPGVGILSAFPNSTYAENMGTSMAGPHIAGVVALMWSANPKLMGQIDQTERVLQETAEPLSGLTATPCDEDQSTTNLEGVGLVNAFEAVKAALNQ